jgi:hypothetical protein
MSLRINLAQLGRQHVLGSPILVVQVFSRSQVKVIQPSMTTIVVRQLKATRHRSFTKASDGTVLTSGGVFSNVLSTPYYRFSVVSKFLNSAREHLS